MRTGLRVAITAVVVISTVAIAWTILSNKDDTKKPATEKARGVKPNTKRQSRSADEDKKPTDVEKPKELKQEEVQVNHQNAESEKVPEAIVENEMMIDEKGEEPKKEQVEKHCEDAESEKVPEVIVENEKVPEAIVENEMTIDEKDNEPKHKDVENHCNDTENEQTPEPIVESEMTMDEPKQEEVENRCEDVESKVVPIVENEMAMEEDEPKEEQVEDAEEAPKAIVENETTMDEPKKEEVKIGAGINPNATPFVPSAYKPKKVSLSFNDVLASQKQSRKPTKKSRCTYWPKCSNKNCKFYHPQTQCRSGDGCRFASKCIYLHPSDLASMH